MYIERDYENLRRSGRILRECLEMLEKNVRAGISTLDLDKQAEDFILANNAAPSFKNYQGFKHTICASINDESVHGIPRADRILCDGDIISIDCGVRYPRNNGMCSDAARTVAVGKISHKAQDLINITRQSFDAATVGLRAGQAVSEIGKRIDKFINGKYGIVELYFGHGIGKNLHEKPLIPNFDVTKKGVSTAVAQMGNSIINEGDIICIEPMINAGTHELKISRDGWTAVTADGELAAHYENTLIVWRDRIEIIT
jgi:methionyl aminopeptidase